MHCEASAANLSVKRLDCAAAWERRTGFLNPMSEFESYWERIAEGAETLSPVNLKPAGGPPVRDRYDLSRLEE